MCFEVVEKVKTEYVVDVFLINDEYDLKRSKILEPLVFLERPNFSNVIEKLNEKYPDLEVHHVYKLNNFDEPIKEILFNKSKEINFDSEHVFRMMLKRTTGKLDFQSINFIIYTPNVYPTDLQKLYELKVDEDIIVKDFKQMILTKLIELGTCVNIQSSAYHFQFLNQFNIPAKYLTEENEILKKFAKKSNKLVVRTVDICLPSQKDFIAVFCRKRISSKRIYESYDQVFLPKNVQKINSHETTNFLKELMIKKLNLGIKTNQLNLTIVDYKNLKWKLLEKENISLRNGDEIGYLILEKGSPVDDMQTDEFLALSLNENRENYVFNHKSVKETPFSINLD